MEEDYLIFEDEPLDEIEIKEYVTLEEILKDNPRFLAFSESDLYTKTDELLSDDIRTRAFIKLHKSVLLEDKSRTSHQIHCNYTLPKLDVIRDDFEDINLYFEGRDRAANSINYLVQQQKLMELSLPYIWEKGKNTYSFVPKNGILFTLNDSASGDTGKLLPFDNIEDMSFIGARWVLPKYTSENYLSEEYSNPKSKYKYIKWNEPKPKTTSQKPKQPEQTQSSPETSSSEESQPSQTTQAAQASQAAQAAQDIETHDIETHDPKNDYSLWVEEYVLPSLSQVIEKTITQVTDLHELKALLYRYSYILDEFNDEQLDILIKHLESIIDTKDTKDTKSEVKKNKEKKAIEGEGSEGEGSEGEGSEGKGSEGKDGSENGRIDKLKNINYWESVRENNKRFLILTREEVKKQLEERIGNYITTLKNLDKFEYKDEPIPYKLAEKVELNELSVNDVAKIIKSRVITVHQMLAEKLYINVTAFHVPQIENIDKEKELYTLISKSIIDDKSNAYITKWIDYSEIKAGHNTAKYDGSPFSGLNNIFEETENTFLNIGSVDVDGSILELGGTSTGRDAIISATIDNSIEEVHEILNAPLLLDISEGARDIFEEIIKNIIEIKNISGLPLDIEDLFNKQKVYIIRLSRVQEICEALPELPNIIAKRICSYTLEDAIEYIKDLANTAISDELQKIYPPIYNQWKKDCKYNIRLSLTIWWLDLLEKSIDKQLNFSILRGVIEHINTWSPYGQPVEDTRDHGILQYLSIVASDVQGIAPSVDSLRRDMVALSTTLFEDKINKLKEKWAASKKQKDKTKRIRDIIAETIRAIKAKESINVLANFVESYIYLPTLLPNAKIKKLGTWGHGCCLVIIGNRYDADNDWKEELKPLWRLKELLAKDRWLTIARPKYRMFIPSPPAPAQIVEEGAQAPIMKIEKREIVAEEKYKLMANDIWLPASVLNKLSEDYEGTLYATEFLNNTIDRLYGTLSNKKKEAIKKAINDNKTELNILNIIAYIATNLQQIIGVAGGGSGAGASGSGSGSGAGASGSGAGASGGTVQEYLDIIKTIKTTLSRISHSGHPIYIYAFAVVLALPGRVNNINNFILPANISTSIMERINTNNYNYIIEYTKANSMMTTVEIQNYITKMREEEKNIKLDYQDELSNDDRRLLKDMKRFGLKVDIPRSAAGTSAANLDGTGDINGPELQHTEDERGEADFAQLATDYDRDDERLDD